MSLTPGARSARMRAALRRTLVVSASVMLLLQPPIAPNPRDRKLPISGFDPHLPFVAPEEKREWGSLIQGLKNNDAMFEVVVGQGRLLTLKQDLVAPGKPRPLIAVGDPSVIEFEVVGPRQI